MEDIVALVMIVLVAAIILKFAKSVLKIVLLIGVIAFALIYFIPQMGFW